MPRFDLTPKEYELLMALMTAGSAFVEFGTREWKEYLELKHKIDKQVEG